MSKVQEKTSYNWVKGINENIEDEGSVCENESEPYAMLFHFIMKVLQWHSCRIYVETSENFESFAQDVSDF